MKKFLLSVALAALATVSTSAESTTLIFDFTNPGAPSVPYTLSPETFAELKANPAKYTYQTDKTKYWRIKLTGESIKQDVVTITPTTTGADWPRFFFNTKSGVAADDWNWDATKPVDCGFDCDFRIYKGTNLKFEAAEGFKITKIVFTGYRFNASTVYEFQNVIVAEGTPGTQTITEKATAPYTNTWKYDQGLSEVNFAVPSTAPTQICRKITVTVENGTNSIDDLVSDSADVAPRYYNLQGREVAQPVSGVYVMVKGGKATKVIF